MDNEDFVVNSSMFDMFQSEALSQIDTFKTAIDSLSDDPSDTNALDDCIRASSSIKGASQLVKIQLATELSSVTEVFFIRLRDNIIAIKKNEIESIHSVINFFENLANFDISEHETPDESILNKRNELISTVQKHIDQDASENNPSNNAETDVIIDLDIDPMMFDLFKTELDNNVSLMSNSLLILEDEPGSDKELEQLMRSSHSIKGAARLLQLDLVVQLAHSLEDCFVAAQNNSITINTDLIDVFLQCVDTFKTISSQSVIEYSGWCNDNLPVINQHIENLSNIYQNNSSSSPSTNKSTTDEENNFSKMPPFKTPENIDPVMLDLFTTELGNNIDIISTGLLDLEAAPNDPKYLEQLMRASHSIKGAARLLNIESVVKLAHHLEDCFVAAQNKTIIISNTHIDIFLKCVDILKEISSLSENEHASWTRSNTQTIYQLITELKNIEKDKKLITKNTDKNITNSPAQKPEVNTHQLSNDDNVVRVSAKRINRLMSLAGELTVTSNWVRNHSSSMMGLKKNHNELIDSIDRLRVVLEDRQLSDLESDLLSTIQLKASNYREKLTTHIIDLDDFDRRASNISGRINHEVIASRMRPFKDSTQGYKRMVRDISRSLNKKIKLEIVGEDTQVDREILEKIEAPVNHMIRNAIDHGIEYPTDRLKLNKPEVGTITLKAAHNAGRLSISVEDDGKGVDIDSIRTKVLEKNLVNKTMAVNLSKSELLDFLFLPAFSTRDSVTEISGRGVGLDVVHSALQDMRGKLHSSSELGQGMKIHMELPLTLSVIRSLLVKVSNELYAFPLASIHNLIHIHKSEISMLEDKQYITLDGNHIGLIHTAQILGVTSAATDTDNLSIVIIGDWNNLYGLVVDQMIGERGLALRPLDPRLGKVKDINSSALTDEGEPILIFDVDDLIQSVQDIISGKSITKIGDDPNASNSTKRVLVVDDSLTVREVEKKLLESRGYYVDVAIDGVDAWNTMRNGKYDLVITDVDMPRMNGIELVTLIKNDAALRNVPVMMVSYKDRPEDKQKGMEAGADYYLTKGSFHDETLIDAVRDLIGNPK